MTITTTTPQGTKVVLTSDLRSVSLGRVLPAGTVGRIAGPVIDGRVEIVSARWNQGERWRLSFRADLWAVAV